MLRKIIKIDEEKCNGCGQCVTACAEGALQIVNGKAKLVNEVFCDGLGACIGECPTGALKIEEQEASDFDENAVKEHLKKQHKVEPAHHSHSGGACPGSTLREMHSKRDFTETHQSEESQESALEHWPVQLKLVPPVAPFLKGADLLICADCVPFIVPHFHSHYLKGKKVLVGCPKLDDLELYRNKLRDIFKEANPKSITVLRVEVPCCAGLANAAIELRDELGLDIPVTVHILGINGGEEVIEYKPKGNHN